jgi:hypothetical protein
VVTSLVPKSTGAASPGLPPSATNNHQPPTNFLRLPAFVYFIANIWCDGAKSGGRPLGLPSFFGHCERGKTEFTVKIHRGATNCLVSVFRFLRS